MTKIQLIRKNSFKHQSGRCYYCYQPMWLSDLDAFAQKYQVPKTQAIALQATAEHLIPRSDGGPDTSLNIVAACKFCNSHRHQVKSPLTPEGHRNEVRQLLAQGKWHGLRLGAPA